MGTELLTTTEIDPFAMDERIVNEKRSTPSSSSAGVVNKSVRDAADKLIRDKTLRVFDHMIYTKRNGVWTPDDTTIRRAIYKHSPTLKRAVHEEILYRVQMMMDDVNEPKPRDLNHINFLNGRYNLDTRKLEKYPRNHVCFYRINHEYDPNTPKEDELVDNYIDTLVEGGEQEILLVWQMLGYILNPDHSHQVSFLMHGEGGTGKSLMLRLIAGLIGEENCAVCDIDKLENDVYRATLFGKQACLIDEAGTSYKVNNTSFKSIVAGERVTAKILYNMPIQFAFDGVVVMAANAMPRIFDGTEGPMRRVRTIHCRNATIPPDKGSPPRTRGAQLFGGANEFTLGITPAYAGSTGRV